MGQRALRFGVVTAFPTEDWHSARILAALAAQGEAEAVDPSSFAVDALDEGLAVSVGGEAASRFDAFVLARGLAPKADADAQFSIYRALQESGALVLNRLDALLAAQDKLRTSGLLKAAGVPTPRAALATSPEQAARLVMALGGDIVAKPLAGSLGEGVERLPPGRQGAERAARRADEEGAVYLQEWVPNDGRDLRIFVVGGRVVGAVERVAAAGEFRTNIARGARARPVQITKNHEDLAERSARALGLDYTGVDVIEGPDGPRVIEVNGNPAFDMIFHATGEDMAVAIAEHVALRAREARVAERRREESALGWMEPASQARNTAH